MASNFNTLYRVIPAYVNEVFTLKTRAFTKVFDVANTDPADYEYFFDNGFDFVFELI